MLDTNIDSMRSNETLDSIVLDDARELLSSTHYDNLFFVLKRFTVNTGNKTDFFVFSFPFSA